MMHINVALNVHVIMDKRRRDELVHAHMLGHLVRKTLVHNLRREYQDITEEIHSFEGKSLISDEVISWPRKTTLCLPVFIASSHPNTGNSALTSDSLLKGGVVQRSGSHVSLGSDVVSGRPFISSEPSISNNKKESCCKTCPDPPFTTDSYPSPAATADSYPPAVNPSSPDPPVIEPSDPHPPAVDPSHPHPPAIDPSDPHPPDIGLAVPDLPAVNPSSPDPPVIDPSDPHPPAIDPSDPHPPAVDPSDPHPPAIDPSDPHPSLGYEMENFEQFNEVLSLLPDLPQSREGLIELKAQLSMELLWLKQAIASRQSYLQLRKSLDLTDPN